MGYFNADYFGASGSASRGAALARVSNRDRSSPGVRRQVPEEEVTG